MLARPHRAKMRALPNNAMNLTRPAQTACGPRRLLQVLRAPRPKRYSS